MENKYQSPTSNVSPASAETNNSGMGEDVFPEGIKGWSWGAFFFSWIWAIFNKTWIGLIALVPYVGFIMTIALGVKGREWAWKNKTWDSVEHFQDVQRKWSMWAGIIFVAVILIAIVVTIIGS